MAKKKASGKKTEPPVVESGLTPMQELFVLNYCSDPKFNASAAAKAAGYSEATADQLGYQLLQNPSVRKAISEKIKERFDTLDITGERILREIAKVAFGNLKQVATWDGKEMNLLASDEIDDDGAALLKSISVSESSSSSDKGDSSSKSISFQTFDKMKALELLAKNHGLLKEVKDLNVKGKLTLEQLLAASQEDE